jgi:hypothetical protein
MAVWAAWAAVLVTLIVNLMLAAWIGGGLNQKIENNTLAIKALDGEQDDQWAHINRNRENIGRIKGRLGLNGELPELPPPVHKRRHASAGGD